MFDLFTLAIAFVLGIGAGAAGYRYMLKKDPATLEKWAAEAKALGDKAKSEFDNYR